MCVSEHGLYEPELYQLGEVHEEFYAFGKSSESLNIHNMGKVPGHSGIGIMWRKSYSGCIKKLKDLTSDRVCGIQLTTEGERKLYVISVYLPQRGCYISDFGKELDDLENIIEQCNRDGNVLVIGDINVHFAEGDGPRCWGKGSVRSRALMHMVERRSLYVYDISNFAVGPTYTFVSTRGMSYIDHCLVSASLVDSILRCEIEEHILNTSDHLPIKVDVHVSGMTPVVTNTGILKERVAWERLRAGDINSLYTIPL